jgi:hypothetical protein
VDDRQTVNVERALGRIESTLRSMAETDVEIKDALRDITSRTAALETWRIQTETQVASARMAVVALWTAVVAIAGVVLRFLFPS